VITVYTKPACGTCDATKIWLNRNRVDFIQVDVTTDADARAFVDSLGYTSLPVVVADDGTHWSGFRVEKLAALAVHHAQG
jgi:glutaredoxin-like protein NrdH